MVSIEDRQKCLNDILKDKLFNDMFDNPSYNSYKAVFEYIAQYTNTLFFNEQDVNVQEVLFSDTSFKMHSRGSCVFEYANLISARHASLLYLISYSQSRGVTIDRSDAFTFYQETIFDKIKLPELSNAPIRAVQEYKHRVRMWLRNLFSKTGRYLKGKNNRTVNFTRRFVIIDVREKL